MALVELNEIDDRGVARNLAVLSRPARAAELLAGLRPDTSFRRFEILVREPDPDVTEIAVWLAMRR